MVSRCAICREDKATPLYEGILRCVNCGHIFSDARLNEEDFFKLYGSRYFFGGEYSDYLAEKKALHKNFKYKINVLQRYLDPIRHKRLLEIGCAYGFFLDVAKDYFDEVLGLDVSEEAIQYASHASKHKAERADFLKYDFEPGKFDVVCLWDTIEHLERPELYIEKIGSKMKKRGLLAITTGDIGSINASIRKDKWRLMHPPTHVHYFSEKSLTRLLNKHGFEVRYNRYCGVFRGLDIIAYRMFGANKGTAGIYNLLKKLRITEINFYLNLYDIMYVIAEKC